MVGMIAFRDDWIDQFYVLPQAQRQGAGTALLGVAQSSLNRLNLWTFQRNERARFTYRADLCSCRKRTARATKKMSRTRCIFGREKFERDAQMLVVGPGLRRDDEEWGRCGASLLADVSMEDLRAVHGD